MNREQALVIYAPSARSVATKRLWRLTKSQPLPTLAALAILAVALVAILAPLLAPYSPLEQSYSLIKVPPTSAHWLGTDEIGRDVLSRIIFGSRISLTVGIIVVLAGTSTGAAWGVACGYLGGRFDLVSQRLVETLQSIPSIVLAICLLAALGPGLGTVIVALSIAPIAAACRITRSVAISTRESQFVEAATVIGATRLRIGVRHVAPSCVPAYLIVASANIGATILAEASLGFLGLGVPPPTPTWGSMIGGILRISAIAPWWLVVFPGLAITITVLAFNLLGDGLRDILDPKLRGKN